MDIRKMVASLTGCPLPFPVEEAHGPGLSISYDGCRAVIRAASIPAKARGYLLLTKAFSEGKSCLEISQTPAFSLIGPMLDVSRGAVMQVASVQRYLDYVAALGMNMLMLYTEDTYEVAGYPFFGYQRGRYTLDELRQIDDYAYSLGIEVIPCIQTFGHLEQYFRYPASKEIQDSPSVLLAGEEKTYDLIRACVATVRQAFRSNRIHIGCDETRGLGLGTYLNRNGYRDRFSIFNEHLQRVTAICREFGYRPMMWSDMYFTLSNQQGAEDFAPELGVPQYAIDAMPDCDMVFWDYYHCNHDFYRTNIEKHKAFHRPVLFAGGIWTFEGMLPYLSHSYNTMKPALDECLRGGIREVIITLWGNDGSETNYRMALPMLPLFSEHCWLGTACTKADHWDMSQFLFGVTEQLSDAISGFFFGYDGAVRAGKHILWSDPLINLLFQDFDLEAAQKYLTDGLAVFENYSGYRDIAYCKAVFRCCLDKCRLHSQLRDRYLADDRPWLRDFADVEIPRMVADFEALEALHYASWHEDYKTHGYERLMYRYAGAKERLRYTAQVIRRYLDGELPCIAELDPEPLHQGLPKWYGADHFMYISSH